MASSRSAPRNPPKNLNSLLKSPSDRNPLSCGTPAKSPPRLRNRNVALSVNEVRKAAQRNPRISDEPRINDNITSARRQITFWPDQRKKKVVCDDRTRLPAKHEELVEFFNSLESVITLLRMRGSSTNISNISPKIECLTDRRFSFHQMAQSKFLMPEAIVLKKVLVFDELTGCTKPELNVSILADAINNGGKLKTSGSLHLRNIFRSRLVEFMNSHGENEDVPEGLLPDPFNTSNQDMKANITSLSSEKKSTEFQDSIVHKSTYDAQQNSTGLKTHSEKVAMRPEIDSSDEIGSKTPAKVVLTPTRLMIRTPIVAESKKCYRSPIEDDDVTGSPNKLVKRPSSSRSLKFDTLEKNESQGDADNQVYVSVDDDDHDVLPHSLLQSIRAKELKIKEEQDPAISQAKRRQQMTARLPKLMNVISYFLQSINRSVIKKAELLDKIVAGHSDIVDKSEIEEQLKLLLELVPEWITEKSTNRGVLLIRVNKCTNMELIRAKLVESHAQNC